MPSYNFRNTETGEVFEAFLSIKEKEIFLEDNPNLIQIIISAPKTVSGVGDLDSKTDNTWKEVLSKISEKHPGSELASRYGSKSIKQLKTEKIIDKHLKIQTEKRETQ